MGAKGPARERSTQWHETKAKATKTAVIVGAARVFDRVGYRNAVVADISAESATTTGAMYHYFPSKEAVALAVVDEARVRLLALYGDEPGGSPAEQLLQVCARVSELLLQDEIVRAGFRLAFEQSGFSQSPAGLLRDWEVATAAIVNRAIGAGEIVGGIRAETLTRLLVLNGVGSIVLLGAESGEQRLPSDVRSFLELLLRAQSAVEHRERLIVCLERAFASADPRASS